MTPEELDDMLHEVGNDAVTPEEFREVCAALRAAWAERDAYKIEVDEKHWDVSELSLELMQARHERDARPDATTIQKVRALLKEHVRCSKGDLYSGGELLEEALRLLEIKR